MSRVIIPISLENTSSVSGDPFSGDKAQADIAAAIAAAAANTTIAGDGTALGLVNAISTAVATALANEPQIVLSYDGALSKGQVSRALKEHL